MKWESANNLSGSVNLDAEKNLLYLIKLLLIATTIQISREVSLVQLCRNNADLSM